MTLTQQDCLDVGFCTRGQKRFCRQHGLDYLDFLKKGLSEEQLSSIQDSNLTRALSRAAERERGAS